MQEKLWVHKDISESDVSELSSKAGISRLLSKVFVNRGITDPEYVQSFLKPDLDFLHDPFLMKDMDAAADRIVQAVDKKEKIVIYGDYDVDGVTSTSMLYCFLKSIGANVDYYIPERLDEGYGLSMGAVDKVRQMGASLVITVDCGITAVEEVRHIYEVGMEAVITDHHKCRDVLPEACAVVNPCRADCPYPFKSLAGVGVVFKLVQALCMRRGLGRLHERYLDLAALGTVADVVPLQDENRAVVKFGLGAIERTSIPGMKALLEVAGLSDKPVTTYGAGFALAPRVNAAGRVGSAARAVRLFTTDDAGEAEKLARELDEENRYRQEAEAAILRQVISQVEAQVDLEREKVIVAAGEDWHHGVIGIVASRVTERYHRPSILISLENGAGKGSGRSIEGFNLYNALVFCDSLLEKYGGHELAAGISIREENLAGFRRLINEYADTVLTDADLIPCIKLDAYIERGDISIESVQELERLAPFGSGNPSPVFAYRGLDIGDIRTVSDNRHLKLRLEDGSLKLDAIGFNLGTLESALRTSDTVDAVFSLEMNTWNNSSKVQLNLKDIRPFFSSLDKYIVFDGANDYNIDDGILKSLKTRSLEEIIPERSDLAAVYRHIRSCCGAERCGSEARTVFNDLYLLARQISETDRVSMNYFKLKKSIEIFEELKFLKKEPAGDRGLAVTLFSNSPKADLLDSPLFVRLQRLKLQLADSAGKKDGLA